MAELTGRTILEEPYRVPGEYVYKGVMFSEAVRKSVLDSCDQIECREDDVFVVSYPKSGTTWVLEMTNLVMHPEQMSHTDKVGGQEKRIPFLEFHDDKYGGIDHVENMKTLESPRLIKTHLPAHLFPAQGFKKKSKIIYICRNPKDNAVSYFYFYKSVENFGYYKGSWDAFLGMFLKGNVAWGSWFDHVLGWWKYSYQPNVLFLQYEDVKKDEISAIMKIASFLGKDLDNETVNNIASYCSFENMKKNPAVNRDNAPDVDNTISPFMRKGIVGDWKNHFTVSQNEQLEKIYHEQLENSGLEFEWW